MSSKDQPNSQYVKLFQVLSECLNTCTVPEIIAALDTLRGKPALKKPARVSKKKLKAYYTTLIVGNIRATKPEQLKNK